MTSATRTDEVVQLRWRAMGTDVHVIVVGTEPAVAAGARRRIDDLEQRWSRFRPDSEVSRLNRAAGHWVAVSADTVHLVRLAVEAWRLTGGAFDPTVLGALVRAGYDRSFDDLGEDPGPGASSLLTGCTDIEVDEDSVRLPVGTGFDPGGIGKGLAADLVAAETKAAGAAGVCINLGGDLRVLGTAPEGGSWTVAVTHAWQAAPITHIGLGDGAVATSTTLRRRWQVDGAEAHHVIDPATGAPSDTDLNQATVVAGEAWMAEVLAKAVLLRGSAHPFDLVDGCGPEALAVTTAGEVLSSGDLSRFTAGSIHGGGVGPPLRLARPPAHRTPLIS